MPLHLSFRGEAEESAFQSSGFPIIVSLRAVEHFDRILPLAAQLLEAFRICHPERREGSAFSNRPTAQFGSSAVPQFGNVLALLIGSSQLAAAHRLLPNFAWDTPIPIPLSHSRILLFGRPTAVSSRA
jgi:hypothetical protein